MKKSKRMRMTRADLIEMIGPQRAKQLLGEPQEGNPAKKSKHRNERVLVDGVLFASKLEFARWCDLKLMEKAGLISDLERQVPFELAPAVKLDGKRKKPSLRYFADAVYIDKKTGERVVEDTKGFLTQTYKAKRHLMFTVHGIIIKEVK
jgi:hypothetical protein